MLVRVMQRQILLVVNFSTNYYFTHLQQRCRQAAFLQSGLAILFSLNPNQMLSKTDTSMR